MTPPQLKRPLRNWAICLEYKTGPKIHALLALSFRMTLILFTVFAGKTCSAVSLLPQDFNANFSRDPFTGDAPHDMFMRQVLHRNGPSCGTVHNRTAQRAEGVIDLKLHHMQMHHRQSPFLNVFTKRTTTKGVKNTLRDMKNLGSIQPNHIQVGLISWDYPFKLLKL